MLCFGSVHHAQTCWFGGMHLFGMFWCMQNLCWKYVVKSLGVESHVLIKCAELLSEMFPNLWRSKGTFPQFHLLVLSFDLHVLELDMGIWYDALVLPHLLRSSAVKCNLRNDCLWFFCSHLLFRLPLNYWSSTACPVQVISDVCVVALGCFLGSFGMIGPFTVCSVQKITMYRGRILKGWLFLLPKCFSNPTQVRSQVQNKLRWM